jgi:hypothetical protein
MKLGKLNTVLLKLMYRGFLDPGSMRNGDHVFAEVVVSQAK